MGFKCSEVKEMVSAVDKFLVKNKIALNDAQQSAVNSLYSAADNVLTIVKSNTSDLTSLLKDDDKLAKTLAERFKKINDILLDNQFFSCLEKCNFSDNMEFTLSVKTLKRNFQSADSSKTIGFVKNVLETNYKKLKKSNDNLVKMEGNLLKFVYDFISCIQSSISSMLYSGEVLAAIQSFSESDYPDKKKHGQIISHRVQQLCPDKFKLISERGVLGPQFSEGDSEQLSKLSVFNYDASGKKIVIDSKSFNQGSIKNCYFISALKSLSNNPNAVKYLRNCFDKMTDDDLKFAKEKTTKERLDKVFTIGFYNVDFGDLSIDELQHLGSMNKNGSVIKSDGSKTYYKVSCKDLHAVGIEPHGTEIWPLLIEHAWGHHLVNMSKELGKLKSKLPFSYVQVTDPTNPFPKIQNTLGKNNIVSAFADNMYDSIALVTLTGRETKVVPVKFDDGSDCSKLISKLKSLSGNKLLTVFKSDKNPNTSYIDPITGKKVYAFSGHSVSVKDVICKEGEWIVEMNDTMTTVGDKGVFHLKFEDFKKEYAHSVETEI